MRKSDLFLVAFIALAGVVIAYFVCGAMMDEIKPVSFKTVGSVTASLASPDAEVFNSAALNPTVETYVGSCVDPDQNGELDLAESVLCQEITPDEEEEDAAGELQDLLNQITGNQDGTAE